MEIFDRFGNKYDVHTGFKFGKDYFDLIDFLKSPSENDFGRNSFEEQLLRYFSEYMCIDDIETHNFLIESGRFDLAARNLNSQNNKTLDSLTGCRTRKFLDKKLESLVLEFDKGYINDFGFVMCDLDNFKSVNDNYGHDIGDQVLKNFSSIVLDSLRPNDSIFRYGGEEFVVLLPNLSLDDSKNVAERVRKNIFDRLVIGNFGVGEVQAWDLPKYERPGMNLSDVRYIFTELRNLTCSFGVECYSNVLDLDLLKENADSSLYRAKNTGRNKVESFATGF